ncbi:LamG domain-containing protein [Halosolutus halophilus]|uniref:LamG domain-containing protein n=1 Tax=Halosolutus halophilus TaxID=1552990 RepID=UPI0022352DFD|nr:LamG domain-containing protein [Halosolutus halophilus]
MSRYWLLSVLLFAVVATAGYVASPVSSLSDDQVIHYDFGEDAVTDETVRDVSGERNHGEIVTDDDHHPDVSDGAMLFKKGSHYVVLELEERPLKDDFTVVVEVRNGFQEYFAGVVASNSWRIVAPYDRYGFYTTEEGIDSDDYEDREWKHLTAIHRDGTFELYVDGEFVDEFEISEDVETETIYVGRRPGGYSFDGEIAEVRIYDRAVSPAEVNALYADRLWLPAAFFTEEFRLGATIAVALLAFGTAGYEVRRTDG